MKKLLALTLSLLMILTLAACGAGKNDIVGTWEITDGEGATYGWGIRFDKDGKFYYATGTETSEDELQEAFESMEALISIKYKVKSDTQMELTVSVLGGFGGKETSTVDYLLEGDTLTFDGATYTRAK
ncbi:MAG: hypothetical protein PHE47_01870 [Oscillospiraceae bacterium]|nr:hypothetical protein [Oscillospiraceae bacterium]